MIRKDVADRELGLTWQGRPLLRQCGCLCCGEAGALSIVEHPSMAQVRYQCRICTARFTLRFESFAGDDNRMDFAVVEVMPD